MVAAERGKERAARFIRLAHIGQARLFVPLPDAIVIASAAILDAVVVTGDVADFIRLGPHFPGVTLLSV